jgi:hypothetical protein
MHRIGWFFVRKGPFLGSSEQAIAYHLTSSRTAASAATRTAAATAIIVSAAAVAFAVAHAGFFSAASAAKSLQLAGMHPFING